jgi:hypothetical protein
MHSSLREVIILFLLLATNPGVWAQSDAQALEGDYLKVYEVTQKTLLNDPLLQNGIYYTYPYHSALGHPFLGDGEFEPGAVTFREKSYEGIHINYDLFNQQIIFSRKKDELLQMNLMANEFISAFSFKGKNFKQASFPGESAPFYQVISETKNIACYYVWYKERREVLDSGNQRIFSFSEQKCRHYLFLDGKLSQYKNNRSFVQLLPNEASDEIKSYFKENRLTVKVASDKEMRELIEYCNLIMVKDSKLGGE